MKKIISLLFKKPTVFSILGTAIIIIGLPIGIYGLSGNGWERLGGIYLLMGVLIAFLILVIDRVVLNSISQRRLNLIECIVLLLGISVYSYNERNLLVDIKSNTSDYFVIIENNGNFQDSPLKYSFPFNKKLIPRGNHAVINTKAKKLPQIETPKEWKGYEMSLKNIENTAVQFYSNYQATFEEIEIDSLIRKEIDSGLSTLGRTDY